MKKILIVGAGYMAQNYLDYLINTNNSITIIGKKKNKIFLKKKNHKKIFISYGGIEKTKIDLKQFDYAIVAVNEKFSFKIISKLIKNKIKNILIEKPGAKNLNELKKIQRLSSKNKCKLFIAYNRRFYQSIKNVKKIVRKDGGILSAEFSFTEWIDKIKSEKFENYLMKKWFYFNSLHLIDLVFYLIGEPKFLASNSAIRDKYFTKSLYVGSGITKKNIYFSYHSNWNSAGRWGLNIYTKSKKIILSPLEEIQIQERNSNTIKFLKFNKNKDKIFKPGIPGMVDSFLLSNKELLKIEEYIHKFKIYKKIAGYIF